FMELSLPVKGRELTSQMATRSVSGQVHFEPARKGDRVSGWQRMRRLLADAGKPDRPGLYVSRACRYWWLTAPYAGRDPKRPEDVDSAGADHALDAMRYGTQRVAWATELDIRLP